MNTIMRVFYNVDGTVMILSFNSRTKRQNETEDEWRDRISIKIVGDSDKHPQHLNVSLVGKEYDNIDISDFPAGYEKNMDKLRGSKGNPLIIDNSVITDAERRQGLEDELDAELAKTNPNAVKALRLKRRLDKKDYS